MPPVIAINCSSYAGCGSFVQLILWMDLKDCGIIVLQFMGIAVDLPQRGDERRYYILFVILCVLSPTFIGGSR